VPARHPPQAPAARARITTPPQTQRGARDPRGRCDCGGGRVILVVSGFMWGGQSGEIGATILSIIRNGTSGCENLTPLRGKVFQFLFASLRRVTHFWAQTQKRAGKPPHPFLKGFPGIFQSRALRTESVLTCSRSDATLRWRD
jgi:hypothetical protein